MSAVDGWDDLLKEHGLSLVIVARSDGAQVLRVQRGEVSEHVERLANSRFGDLAETRDLATFLEGKILPQVVRLGPVDCFISEVKELGLIFGAFTAERPKDPAAMYTRGEAIAAAVAQRVRDVRPE